ncbi:hypothetical protein GGTG_06785 [Gaeumannomyces tritici R3-111a-1]|uniref:DUF2293 domain-containing protein n=1 Tax=Gaeumannomyces tritici (strain R3-111a-1) TaxID=644352 RepID=J3NZT8_GAET3|nr:hypothetical protein GGTG_06785 [Gaeumannomyces tritici R3-111a-1]EJT76871.1 hypothetical protein GGTG_06785 [Gaeumannomyces tritici R3-111a-1]
MGKKKKSKAGARAAAGAGPAKKRQKRLRHQTDRRITPGPLPPGVVARIPAPVITSKHRTYLEFVENKDKKKKLEFEVTTAREPPPGFEFVPVGNPDLTKACKELSRGQDAMIFIVSDAKEADANRLGIHMNRVGHHIRRTIVEEARAQLGQPLEYFLETVTGNPEPIPESQDEINAQADGVIRDLFPRMPNTDRQMIIDHSFRKGQENRTVGLAANITLSRRVQLAVLAHIRHTHTRYDQLIREVGWSNARKAVESVCLDFLVKWRGDEETGRDQLDEILREIIVISDSEDSDSDDDTDSDASDDDISDDSRPGTASRGSISSGDPPTDQAIVVPDMPEVGDVVIYDEAIPHDFQLRRPVHRRLNSRNVQRYEAAAQSRWQQARDRVRHEPARDASASRPVATPKAGAAGQADQTQARETSRQPFDLYGRPSVPRDHHNLPSHQGGQEVQARESLPPVAGPEPVPVYRRAYQHTVSHGGIPVISEHENPVDYRALRPTTERPELKDYLVPSVEPRSPQADDSSSPIFVRSLPPRSQQPQPHLLHRPSVNGQAVRRRSRSPLDRGLHHSTVPYLVRERDPLPSRTRVDDERHPEDARAPYGSTAPLPRGGLEGYMEPMRLRSPSYPGHIPREVQRPGPRDGHVVAYSRAPPNNDPRPVMRTDTRVPPGFDYQESRILRTERHPIVVEDWEHGAQRVLLVPSRRVHPEHTPHLKYEGDMRMQQGGGHAPVTALGELPRRTPPHGYAQPLRAGGVRYERQPSREYVPVAGVYSQPNPHPPAPAPARPPSPLFYERIRIDDQMHHPAAAGGFTGRYGGGFTPINVDQHGRSLLGGPSGDQSFPIHNNPEYLPRTYPPNGLGGVPRPQHPPAPAHQRSEYIQLD